MPILILLLALALSACAPAGIRDAYRPENNEAILWRNETIPIDPQWNYRGVQKITIRGHVWNSSLPPADEIQTIIFTTEAPTSPSILLLSRVSKTTRTEIFRYLGGSKVRFNNTDYREAHYGLDSNSTNPEYRRYFELIRAGGQEPAPSYAVRILDRLPVDTTLIRIMELTPGQGPAPLPSYGRLYPQERNELIRKNLF